MINIPDAYQDARFNQEIDRKTGYRTKSVLVYPIMNVEDEVIGAATLTPTYYALLPLSSDPLPFA